MIIKIGDKITDERGRTGKIINIGIATDKNDIGAESDTSLNAKEYDTDLNYTGAITFVNTKESATYWCYFIQIKELAEKDKLTIDF
jgi:hypothetical protein